MVQLPPPAIWFNGKVYCNLNNQRIGSRRDGRERFGETKRRAASSSEYGVPQTTALSSSRKVPASASISAGIPSGTVNCRSMWPIMAPR